MSPFEQFAFSRQAGYDEAVTRRAFAGAVRLRSIVVYCYDPRAVGIPIAVASALGDVYPGEVIRDDHGHQVASTTTLFPVIVAGGRAVDALRSITVAQHLFGVTNIAVVHHSHCGATSFTADGLIAAHAREHGADIAGFYDHGSICIEDYEASLRRDTSLIRTSPGTPPHVDIYGYFYEIDRGTLTEVVRDPGRQK